MRQVGVQIYKRFVGIEVPIGKRGQALGEIGGFGMKADAFRRAVDDRDLDALIATLSPSIVLNSPVRAEPLHGRDAVRALFAVLFEVFDDLRFVGEYTADDGREALHFRWRLGGAEAEGMDLLRFGPSGLVEHYTVMVRPLAGVVALHETVFSRLAGE